MGDALLTGQVFFKMKEMFFEDKIDDANLPISEKDISVPKLSNIIVPTKINSYLTEQLGKIHISQERSEVQNKQHEDNKFTVNTDIAKIVNSALEKNYEATHVNKLAMAKL